MKELIKLQTATLAARKASGHARIGTRVSNGLFQIVEWDEADNLTSISRFMPADACIAALNDYSAVRGTLYQS